MSCILLINI